MRPEISQDLSKGLYESTYVNFTSSLPRALLEEFAQLVASKGTNQLIEQVYDQFLDFVVLEPSLFCLTPSPTSSTAATTTTSANTTRPAYELLHDPASKEDDIEAVVDRVASGLFSVLATLGQLPIIRCPPSNAAEMVARKLDSKLRDHLASRGANLFSNNASDAFQRPVLVILDRNVDLTPMVSHSWTYQALVNDVLDMKLNRVTVSVGGLSPTLAHSPGLGELTFCVLEDTRGWTRAKAVLRLGQQRLLLG